MSDLHRFYVCVDDGYFWVRVDCPYDRSDEKRPCWPHDEDSIPLPAPQGECTYEGWVDNVSAEELLHGEWEREFNADVEWGDGLTVHMLNDDESTATRAGWAPK